MANILIDTFTRANQTDWGTPSGGGADWVTQQGLITIVSNRGRALETAISIASAKRTISQQNSLVITFQFDLNAWSSSGAWFAGVRGDGTNQNAWGIHASVGSNVFNIADNGSVKTAGSFTFTSGNTYSIEMDINSDNTMQVYAWLSSGSKPGSPTVQYTTPFTPSSAGSAFTFQSIGDGAANCDINFFNLSVTTMASPVNSGFFLMQ